MRILGQQELYVGAVYQLGQNLNILVYLLDSLVYVN